MNNQDIYNYIEQNVDEHKNRYGQSYVADEYIKTGHGQTTGAYFDYAKRYIKNNSEIVFPQIKKYKNISINPDSAEPNQKWHLLISYYDYKIEHGKFDMNSIASLERIYCPQLMIWIAEVAGLQRKILKKAMDRAIAFEESIKCCKHNQCYYFDSKKFYQSLKKSVLIDALHWYDIMKILRQEKSWDDVLVKVGKLQ